MGSYAFDVYAYNAPNGSALVRLTPSKTCTLAFRQPAVGFGMSDGQIIIHSDHEAATAANFHRHNLVKVVWVPDVGDEVKVGAFFLEEGDFTALSTREQGGRLLTFHGPNTWYYLERAILREQGYTTESIPWPDRRGGVDTPGYWTWGADADGREPGPIMVRCLEEGRDQPEEPLADATWDFTRELDSAGNAWDALGDTWQVQIGTTILDMAIMFVRSGNFWFRAGPDLDYSAYNADPGVDRTSATFAADKVRFAAGVNIATEVRRKISASVDRSAILVTGSLVDVEEEADRFVFVDGGSSSVPWVGHLAAGEVSGTDRLEAMGDHELLQRAVRSEEAIPLQHIVGDDELNGGYVPFVHYAPGDTVTMHTGTGDHDFNNFGIVVAAVRILHDEAGNWFGVPELGEQVMSADTKAFEERASLVCCGPRPPTPTTPPGAGTPDTVVHQWTFGTNKKCDCHGANEWAGGGWSSEDGGIVKTSVLDHTTGVSNIAASAGVAYGFAARSRYRGGGSAAGHGLFVEFYNSGGTILETHQIVTAGKNAWASDAIVRTSPSGTAFITLTTVPATTDVDDVYITLDGSGSPGTGGVPGDGLPEIIGTPGTYIGAGGIPVVIREAAPTLDDDTDHGFPERTTWIHVDDADDPTQVFGFYVLVEGASGAAEWLQIAAPVEHTHEAAGFLTSTDATDDVTYVADAGATHTIEDPTANVQDITLSEAATLTFPDPTDGKSFLIRLHPDGNSVTWDADVVWPGGSAPTLDGDLHIFGFISDGTKWYGAEYGGGGSATAEGTFFTVDAGTVTYDDTDDVEVSVTSKWGIDSGGDPYFNDAGVTSGEEAALMRDSETGAYFLRPYNF